MSDEEGEAPNNELENLKQKLNDTEKRFSDAEKRLNDSQTMLANALAALAVGGGGPVPAVPTPAEVRREKMTKLYPLLQKSQKVKDYKESSDEPFRKWLDRYHTELYSLGNINCNLDLANHPMTCEEYGNCLQLKLDYDARKRLESAFLTHDPPVTWTTVTIVQVKALMLSEFGKREPDIASVLAVFGPERFKKTKDMLVSQYYHQFQEKLPECLKPTTEAEHKTAIDLVHRSIFYQGLDDRYIEQQLCNLKGDVLTMKQFYDEAVAAEARKKTFEKTGDRCNELTQSSITSISKFEYIPPGNRGSRRGMFGNRGRGQPTENSTNRGRGARRRYPPTCYVCEEVGHYQYSCPKLKNNQQQTSYQHQKNNQQNSAKQVDFDQLESEQCHSKEITVEVPAPGLEYPEYKTDIIQVTNDLSVYGNNTGNVVERASLHSEVSFDKAAKDIVPCGAVFTLTTAVSDAYATTAVFPSTDNIMAGIIFNDMYGAELEVDTAASHNVMSTDMFKALVKKSGNNPPVLAKSGAILRLADGTPSDKLRGCAHLSVKLANKDSSKPTLSAVVPVFVVDGPNCLLGRPAIQYMMPKLYKNLSDIARDSVEALRQSSVAGGRAATSHDACVATTTTASVAAVACCCYSCYTRKSTAPSVTFTT